jgi:LmbE family N-acetylglucosaminyl deacetylase
MFNWLSFNPIGCFMKLRVSIALLAVSLSLSASDIPEDRGISGLKQALERLDVVGSVLHTGAHPDDENSSLLAWLSRGQGARTAYLSTTRGEGGQNLIGTQLFEALGVIRTEELLAARNFDRAQQLFTPNYEFGFSKTADETMEKWGRERLVGDMVRVIRHFRPEVIVSRFSGTPRDGHGHHQAAGIATREAFHAAADPELYPEYGKPWQAKKLYMSAGRGGRGEDGGNAGDIRINVGEYGAALGRSYHEIAMEGRSLHRTQSMGAGQQKGPRYTSLDLIEKTVSGSSDEPIFDRTTHKLMDLARLEPALEPELQALQSQIDAIRDDARLDRPADILPDLIEAIKRFAIVRENAQVEHVQFLLDLKEADFHLAAELAAGLTVEVIVSDESAVPGQEIDLSIVVVNNGPYEFETVRTTTDFHGWNFDYVGSTGDLRPGARFEQTFKVRLSSNPEFTQPYWLRETRQGDRFVWPEGSGAMLPFDPPLLPTQAEIDFDGATIIAKRHAEFRRVDQVYGELRSLLKVVPDLSVRLTPEMAVVPLSGEREKEFTVIVHNEAPEGGTAEISLSVPDGWSVTPPSHTIDFGGADETASVQFAVDVPAQAGEFEVSAKARMGDEEFDQGYNIIAYPHIETRHIYSDATSGVRVFELDTHVESIGYVEGAGDRVAESLVQLGIPITFLTAGDLARGDLSVYDTIVLGIRAYAVREDLKTYNQRLLDYVEDGGTLVVQYNTYQILQGDYGPYPFTINRPHDRVTVEEAPITFVEPDHPALNTPNKISESDFDGWVQERGLYFMGDWDERYTPVLASNDPGEDPKLGGMMVAEIGQGRYVYTGYAFFRQLPAGVPGAYRLFSNLISLGN